MWLNFGPRKKKWLNLENQNNGEDLPPLLEVKGLTKSFPRVLALRGVSVHLKKGEVLSLIGENGAGKVH